MNVSSVLIHIEPKAHFKPTCTYEFEPIIILYFFKGGSSGAVDPRQVFLSLADVYVGTQVQMNETEWMKWTTIVFVFVFRLH